MQPKRFSIKYFAQGDPKVDLDAFVPIFQRWIQEHAVEGLLIDVADYKHVYQGPGVLLIGHEGDYSYDLRQGRPGLRYSFKRELTGVLADDLQIAFRRAANAARKLEAEAVLEGVRFNLSEAEIIFEDRLNTPNTPETFQQLQASLNEFASSLYQTPNVQVESVESDPRKLLTVRIAPVSETVTG